MKKQLILNRNEIVQGPSPKVMNVLHNFPAQRVSMYIDAYQDSILKKTITKQFKIKEEQIIIGYGIEDLLKTIINNLSGKDILLTHELHYTFYKKYADFRGITIATFQLIEDNNAFSFDIEDCINKIAELSPKVILIASPNNPTGNSLSPTEAIRIIRAADKNTLVIIDEAYWGFDINYDQKKILQLIKQYDNVVLLRTFSKFYAMAGLRIGFALCGKQATKMLRYQNHYLGASRILEEAAIAALRSPSYYKNLSREIIKTRDWLIAKTNNLKFFKAYNSNSYLLIVRTTPVAKKLLERKSKKMKAIIFKFVNDDLMRVSISKKEYAQELIKVFQEIDLSLATSSKKQKDVHQ